MRRKYPYHIKVVHHLANYRLFYALSIGLLATILYLTSHNELFKMLQEVSLVPVMETVIERSPEHKRHK